MSDEAAASATPETTQEEPLTANDFLATAAMMGAFVVTILLAILFARPFIANDLQAFEDTGDPTNIVGYIVLLLAFTFFLLWLAKKGKKWAIQLVILTAVGSTIAYVVGPMLNYFTDIGTGGSWGIGIALALIGTAALYFRPEWYVVDAVGVTVSAGAAAIFGISLEPWLVVIMLVALAIYDAIAVYRTKHMLDLADTVIDLRLPILLVIPKHRGYSFLREAAKFKEAGPENKAEREAFFLGLGDLVMPSILVVSSMIFLGIQEATLGAAIGTLVGFGVLMGFVLKGNPQAGLPLLNGGAITGFMAGMFAATGSIVFW